MKKVFLFAAVVALFAACSEEQLATQNVQAPADDNTVNFSVYTPRATRAGTPGDIDNVNIQDIGFGVFAYYTPTNQYDAKATPNFMYNQKVTFDDGKSEWVYEPVKYWPNEYGDAAISEDVDRVSFFAYAPHVEFIPTTGKPDPEAYTGDDLENYQNKNIIYTKKNDATGDPIINYVVDTNPATSVDLLWGVNADPTTYAPIGNNEVTQNVAGLPFIDLVKPSNPLPGYDQNGNRIKFNLRHALAKVKVTIDYIADAFTPDGQSEVIDKNETRIFVRNITMGGFAMEGALNLNNTEANIPLWKDVDGDKDLTFNPIQFNDGRKDSKEGTVGGEQKNEPNQCLNDSIIENGVKEAVVDGKFTDEKHPGVTNKPVLLFGGKERENGGFFYVIPRDADEDVDVEIVYDVETIDPKLAGKLSDLETRGSSIENIISKKAIFGEDVDFEAGKQYEIRIHLGMTSVKIDATVTDWVDDGNSVDVDLPDNQDVLSETSDGAYSVGDQFVYTSYAEAAAETQWGNGFATITGITFAGDQEVVEVYAVPTSGFGGKFFLKYNADIDLDEAQPIFESLEAAESPNGTPVAYVKLFAVPSLEDALKNAKAYTYDPAYVYNGTFSVSGTTLSYETQAADLATKKTMDDIARILGALYRANHGAVRELTINGTVYTWDEEAAGNLKGSNWVDASGKTLISKMVAAFQANLLTSPLTIGTNLGEATFSIPQMETPQGGNNPEPEPEP